MPYTGGEGCSTGCGRCFGIPVSVHWTFWFLAIFQIAITALYEPSPVYIACTAVVYTLILFLTVLFHEFGHIWCTRHFGGSCGSILIWPLGGFSTCHIPDGSCLQEFWVALSGPLMHIPQIIVWVIVVAIAAPNNTAYLSQTFNITEFENGGVAHFFARMAQQAVMLNLLIFLINMFIPAYPMDCVKALAAILVYFGVSILTTAYVISVIGLVLGFILLMYAISAFINQNGWGFMLLMIGLFVMYTSGSLLWMARQGTHRSHPIFQPECFNNPQGGRRPTNNSTPNNRRPNNDVEMGNRASPARPKKKDKAKINVKKKKNAPSKQHSNNVPICLCFASKQQCS